MKRWILSAALVGTTFGGVLNTNRTFAAANGPAKHVIIISIDGLRQDDLTDPALKPLMPNLLALAAKGVEYSNASTMKPSDSFPGTMAYVTGAGPATTGVFYDDSYSRGLVGAGKTDKGTEILNTEEIDKNADLLSGGGNAGVQSIDPAKLPTDPTTNAKIYPHDYLKVNTIFEVAHAAGIRTAYMDKHPAYEIVNGPSGKGVDDLFCPEIDSKGAIVDGKLIDSTTSLDHDVKFTQITKSVPLAMAYDDLKTAALINLIHGQDARGNRPVEMPGLIGVNLQAINIAEKDLDGGIEVSSGQETPSQEIIDSVKHTDGEIATIVSELKSAGVWDQTVVIITAKHGQNPRIGSAKELPIDTLTKAITGAGVEVSQSTADDVDLIWLKDGSQTALAAMTLNDIKNSSSNPGIADVLWGDSLKAANLAGYADRTPDLIVTLAPGLMLSDKHRRSEHGGFSPDDAHVALLVTGGAVPKSSRGHVVETAVSTKQIAVTALVALGLDPAALQGAVAEKTTALPESGIVAGEQAVVAQATPAPVPTPTPGPLPQAAVEVPPLAIQAAPPVDLQAAKASDRQPAAGHETALLKTTKAAYLGVSVAPADATLQSQLGLPEGTGLVVSSVSAQAPADAAGLQEHDIITKLDDQIVVNYLQLNVLVQMHKPGDTVSLTVIRRGQTMVVKAILGETEIRKPAPETPPDPGM